MKIGRLVYVLLGLSLLANVGFLFANRMSSAFFSDQVLWTTELLAVKGVYIFGDKKLQPDPKKMVQHLDCRVEPSNCQCAELILSNNEFISSRLRSCTLMSFDAAAKVASFNFQDCIR